jgi:hypothetical protein
MSANTQKNNKHKSAQFPFWKTKKFKNKKKKKNPQNLNIVKNDFVPSDEDKAIAQGILLNDKRLSFLARSGCNELVRDLIKNPHVASPDRLALIEHLAKASPKIFMPVEKVSLVKHAYEVHFFEKYDKNQVRDILAKLQLAQTRSASSLLEARLKAFKLDRDFFDPKTYEQSAKAVSQIRDSRIFDAEILDLKDRYIFWKISPSFVYAQLQIPKPTGKYKHHNEITDVRLKPVIKVREWPEIEKDFGVNIRTNPVEYAEVLKLRVDNRGEPEVVLEYLRKLNLLTSNFEKYLADAQDILEKAVIEAEEARKEREEFQQWALARARQQKDKIKEAEKSLEIFIKSILEKNSNKPAAVERFKFDKTNSDRTHRDRSVDGARDNWHRICPHCRVPYPFYSSCDCRY